MSTFEVQRRIDFAAMMSARRLSPAGGNGSRRIWGKVLDVDSGPPPTLTVELEPGGTPIPLLRMLDTGVAPVVDDYVCMENVNGDLLVMGRTASVLPLSQAPLYLTTNTQIDNYELQFSDSLGVVVEFDTDISVTCLIPPSTAVPWVGGTTIELYAANIGQITVVPETGVTLRAPNGTRSAHQYATMGLRARDVVDEWVLSGDCTT